MSTWKLELRQPPPYDVDASPIRLNVFRGLRQFEIEQLRLGSHELAEWFRVTRVTQSHPSADRIVLVGDLRRFNNVASQHRQGEFIVEGSVGNGLGGPHGASQIGMRGGFIHVHGDAGDYVGHRMRRGMLVVEGSVGALLASQMIAGTIVVAGTIGAHPAYCMRRGTLVLSQELDLCSTRFTVANPSFTPFHTLLARAIRNRRGPGERVGTGARVSEMLNHLESSGLCSRRGDLAVVGQGEIILPASS